MRNSTVGKAKANNTCVSVGRAKTNNTCVSVDKAKTNNNSSLPLPYF
jgi:hypothetical protein